MKGCLEGEMKFDGPGHLLEASLCPNFQADCIVLYQQEFGYRLQNEVLPKSCRRETCDGEREDLPQSVLWCRRYPQTGMLSEGAGFFLRRPPFGSVAANET
jgi:hypothetical protein